VGLNLIAYYLGTHRPRVPAAEVVVLIDKQVQERLLREAVVACRGVIGSDTDGYCRYRICFHIFFFEFGSDTDITSWCRIRLK